jgi:hypothetical protein
MRGLSILQTAGVSRSTPDLRKLRHRTGLIKRIGNANKAFQAGRIVASAQADRTHGRRSGERQRIGKATIANRMQVGKSSGRRADEVRLREWRITPQDKSRPTSVWRRTLDGGRAATPRWRTVQRQGAPHPLPRAHARQRRRGCGGPESNLPRTGLHACRHRSWGNSTIEPGSTVCE